MNSRELPAGWRSAPLEEILPAEAVEDVRRVLEDFKRGKLGPSPHAGLVEVLEPHREYLLEREVLVEYLAYLLEHAVNSGTL